MDEVPPSIPQSFIPQSSPLRRRLGNAAASAERLPELLVGNTQVELLKDHLERVKGSQLTRRLTQTPTRALAVYCLVPVGFPWLLSWAYREFPNMAFLLEALVRVVVSCACLLTASQLGLARRNALPAQRRNEQQWLIASLVSFSISFDPVLLILRHTGWTELAWCWPVSWIEEPAATASFYLLLAVITLVLSNIASRESNKKRQAIDWKWRLGPLIVMWACSEIQTNNVVHIWMHRFDYLLNQYLGVRHIVMFGTVGVGGACGLIWFFKFMSIFMLALARHPWRSTVQNTDSDDGCLTPRTAQRRKERLILSFIAVTSSALFVVDVQVLGGWVSKSNVGLKVSGVIACELLCCLTLIFWPANLGADGTSAIDAGVVSV